MNDKNFDEYTTTAQMANGKYKCSCNDGNWSAVADSEYGAKEDGLRMFEDHDTEGHYDYIKG